MYIDDELKEQEESNRIKQEREKAYLLNYHIWHIQGHAYDCYQQIRREIIAKIKETGQHSVSGVCTGLEHMKDPGVVHDFDLSMLFNVKQRNTATDKFFAGKEVTYYVEVTKSVLFDPFFQNFLPLMMNKGIGVKDVSLYYTGSTSFTGKIRLNSHSIDPYNFTGLSFVHKTEVVGPEVPDLDVSCKIEFVYPIR